MWYSFTHNIDSRFKNFIGITPTDASFTNVTQGKQYKHAYSLHNNNNQKKTIATQWYTINIDYKFLCIWISSFSLSEYIVEMYLQQYDIASGGQWRPRMYFSWYTSSFILNYGVYDVIESINFSRSSANLQHFSIKCLTVSGSLEQSGQVDSIFLQLRDVDKIFISILNLRKMFRIRGLRIIWI